MNNSKKDVYLTSEGFLKVEEELNLLKKEKRPEVINAIKEARALGDLSENAEYHSARDEQAKLESKIKELEKILENAKIIDKAASNIIGVGSQVKIEYCDTKEVEEYFIVGSHEADPFENKISNESPLAKAMLGKKKDDITTVENKEPYTIKILEIK